MNVPWPDSLSAYWSGSTSQMSFEPAARCTLVSHWWSNRPVSSTAIFTPLPSPRRVVRSGIDLGSFASRTEEPGPPCSRGSPVSVIAVSPTSTWLGATRTGPCARLTVALRSRAIVSSTSLAGSSGFCGWRVNVVTPNVLRSCSFQPVRTACASFASPGPTSS